MKKNALIVAGGNGSRMNSDIPKQFLMLKNKPILMYSIEKFVQYDNIILVLPEGQTDYWQKLCLNYNFNIICKVNISKFYMNLKKCKREQNYN